MWTKTQLFEQPVNEHIRICLRLEYLFQQAMDNLRGASVWHSRLALAALIDILNLLDRPDFKTKLTKELSRHLATFNRLALLPQVDAQKISPIILELEELVDLLHASSGKFGQELRDSDFLNTIRQHLPTPGGTCGFDTPAYQLWLQQPAMERIAHLAHWLHNFETIHAASTLLLRLIRQSNPSQVKTAASGFYQSTLDPQAPSQLVRVQIPVDMNIYPEISVGRHGISMRFFPLALGERSLPITDDVIFKLTVCIL
jgi:cell division protein ZapD